MKVGDKVLVEAIVTSLSDDCVKLAISRDGHAQRMEHVRTHPTMVRSLPGRKKVEA